MPATHAPLTNGLPLFLTPAAKESSKLPSHLFNWQMRILLDAGVSWDNFNPDLRAAFLLGYYLGNVRNGGHSQFIGNARNYHGGNPDRFLDWAMQAAEQYKMPETLVIMRDVRTWIVSNPKKAAKLTGVSPNVSLELKPYDAALMTADTIDEAAWIDRLNTLPGIHAKTFLHESGYKNGYVRFPAIFSEIEEVRLLSTFDAVAIVPHETFEEEVKAAAVAWP